MVKKTVLLGMSGGTDSSTAAIMLKQQGYEVTGVTFIFCDGAENHLLDAQSLATKLNIRHIVYDARSLFKDRIISYFIDEYMQGRTPVPCMLCNNYVKWPLLAAIADENNIEYISTGHYVRISTDNNRLHIQTGTDHDKDQSFFLWGLKPEILRRIVLPLGSMTKTSVREFAFEKGFEKVSQKKDSMSICFCKGDYRDFLKENVDKSLFHPGKFIDLEGRILGNHDGYQFFTIGQRRGLGVNFQKAVFVRDINTVTNQVTLAHLEDMYKHGMILKDYNINYLDEIENQTIICRIRYRKQNTPSKVTIIDANHLRVDFLQPLESIAPGQAAAFYNINADNTVGDIVIGGGIIERSF